MVLCEASPKWEYGSNVHAARFCTAAPRVLCGEVRTTDTRVERLWVAM